MVHVRERTKIVLAAWSVSQRACLLFVAVVAAGGRTTATKRRVVLATWSISHGGMPVMCGCGGSRWKDDCNQVAHLQYSIFVELKFF